MGYINGFSLDPNKVPSNLIPFTPYELWEKFLDILRVRRNSVPSSHIHDRFHSNLIPFTSYKL